MMRMKSRESIYFAAQGGRRHGTGLAGRGYWGHQAVCGDIRRTAAVLSKYGFHGSAQGAGARCQTPYFADGQDGRDCADSEADGHWRCVSGAALRPARSGHQGSDARMGERAHRGHYRAGVRLPCGAGERRQRRRAGRIRLRGGAGRIQHGLYHRIDGRGLRHRFAGEIAAGPS